MRPEELRQFIHGELDAISVYAEMAGVPILSEAIWLARKKLDEHLKLAIVGLTKAGKSTLLNAMLGITELPTGDAIVTRHVSVLLHVDKSPTKTEIAVVHLSDSTQKQISVSQYRELVDNRKVDVLGIRDKIVWFDVYLNNPTLKDMSIIDTPGDDSWLKVDSENTKELFRDKDRKPNIVIYVVRKEFGIRDVESASDYLQKINGGHHHVSGMNVIAVYGCCDEFVASGINGCDWTTDYRNVANRIIESNRSKSAAFRMCFSKCIPVAAQFAMASISITQEDFAILQNISRSNCSEYFYRDISAIEYSEMETMYPDMYKFFKTAAVKSDLVRRLGLETMKYIVWWCKNHPDQEISSLQQDLQIYSNVPTLCSYVLDEHFKKLSIFYKATGILPELRKLVESRYKEAIDSDLKAQLRRILEICMKSEKKIYSQYGFLSVLRDFHDGLDYFDSLDWDYAMQTIAFCISDNQNETAKQEFQSQWKEKMDFYRLIGNHYAIEASEKLLSTLSYGND